MDNARKKELVRGYKEAKRPQGIFALRCDATGESWVAASRNLEAQQNRDWFALRLGSHTNKTLQAVWNAQGEANFRYEILEEVDDENPLLIPALLKDRELFWREKLGAGRVVG
jgi:hypothetical protein